MKFSYDSLALLKELVISSKNSSKLSWEGGLSTKAQPFLLRYSNFRTKIWATLLDNDLGLLILLKGIRLDLHLITLTGYENT